MTRKALIGVTVLASVTGWTAAANAAPVYIGLEEDGYFGNAIQTVAGPSNGTASYTNHIFGDFFVNTISITGTPPLAEPDVTSTAIDATSPTLGTGGTLRIYLTEINQNWPVLPALPYNSLLSQFSNTLNYVVGQNTGSFTVTEATYLSQCGAFGANECTIPSKIFATDDLIQMTTFTNSNGSVSQYNPLPSVNSPFAVTLLYTITATRGTYGTVTDGINLSGSDLRFTQATPLPAAVWLMGGVLGGSAGFGAWRRKRKAAAIAA